MENINSSLTGANINAEQPIGIFDAGPGGLAVLKYIMQYLPSENIIYLGDTARQPYGIQETSKVRKYTEEACSYLTKQGSKIILIGCNTATAAGLEAAKHLLPEILILGMIAPGAKAVVQNKGNRNIGVWGTKLTIESHAYREAILKFSNNFQVQELACPDLLRLAEKGEIQDKQQIIKLCDRYFEPLKAKGVTDLILGCTDLTCVRKEIEYVTGEKVRIIDPAEEIVKKATEILETKECLNSQAELNREYDFQITGEEIGDFRIFVEDFLNLRSVNVKKIFLKENKGKK